MLHLAVKVLPRVSLHSTSTLIFYEFRLSHLHIVSMKLSHLVVHAATTLAPCRPYRTSKSIRDNFLKADYELCCFVPTHFRHLLCVPHNFFGSCGSVCVKNRS